MRRNRGEETRGQLREGASRGRILNMQSALDPRFRPCDDRNGSSGHGVCDEVFAIDGATLKGAEYGPGCNLAIVDREAGHLDIRRAIGRQPGIGEKTRQLH